MKTAHHAHRAAVAAILESVCSTTPLCHAAQDIWTHDPATSSSWSDPLNWSLTLNPTSLDTAYIANGGTALLSSGFAQAHSLYLGDTLAGTLPQSG